MSLQFECPMGLTAEQLIAKLSQEVNVQLISKQPCCKTYYDSFDWRLYSKAMACEFCSQSLSLTSVKTGLVIAEAVQKKAPSFSTSLEPGTLCDTLAPLLEMRALLPVCQLDYQIYHLAIFNKHQKIILRLQLEAYSKLKSRVLLQPVKGYDKTAEQVAEFLLTTLGLTVTNKSILPAALQAQGRKPKDYSSKLNINLAPDMRADIASKYVYSHLLKAIKVNEPGTIADTDSEFLHDFRVAIRRTRAGLSQIKHILPNQLNAYYADFFSWLGQITGPTRDLDVYLLNFNCYKNSLPESIREDLNPLYDFLLAKQQKAQQELAKNLQSARYLKTLAEWEQVIKEPAYKKPLEKNALRTIKEVADRRIWRIFKRVLDEGKAISDSSPAESLHELRKSCKKLRYLMEFFQSLYPEANIKQLIKNLKGLQEVLGDFQDYAVQEYNLKLYSEEITQANTLLAMGMLIQNLESHRCQVRKDYTLKFETFKREENRSEFKRLFCNKT